MKVWDVGLDGDARMGEHPFSPRQEALADFMSDGRGVTTGDGDRWAVTIWEPDQDGDFERSDRRTDDRVDLPLDVSPGRRASAVAPAEVEQLGGEVAGVWNSAPEKRSTGSSTNWSPRRCVQPRRGARRQRGMGGPLGAAAKIMDSGGRSASSTAGRATRSRLAFSPDGHRVAIAASAWGARDPREDLGLGASAPSSARSGREARRQFDPAGPRIALVVRRTCGDLGHRERGSAAGLGRAVGRSQRLEYSPDGSSSPRRDSTARFACSTVRPGEQRLVLPGNGCSGPTMWLSVRTERGWRPDRV